MLYVLDAPAVVSVMWLAKDPTAVFDALTDLVTDRKVCFCDEVLTELERTARRETALTWAKSVAGARTNKGAGYSMIVWVGHDFSDIVDTTAKASAESCAPWVIAQALELQKAHVDVTVVTEDLKRKVTRASVREACEHFGIEWMTLTEFLDHAGIDTANAASGDDSENDEEDDDW